MVHNPLIPRGLGDFFCLEIQFLRNTEQDALFEALQKLKEGQTILSPQSLFPIQDVYYI